MKMIKQGTKTSVIDENKQAKVLFLRKIRTLSISSGILLGLGWQSFEE